MFMQVDKKTVHRNRVVLGLVLAFGFAAQAFAGTSLSCAGYPKNVTVFTNSGISTFVQVCKVVPLTAPLTPSLSVTSIAGNLTAHGGQTEGQIPFYARIIAQDATAEAATALANSVNISTENGAVSSQKIAVSYPQSLEIDYEVFTPSTTDVSLTTTAGNVSADSYTSTVNATTVAGDIALQTLDGDAKAKATAGNITISLNGAGWTGTGLTATTTAGNILLSRPVGYQALITASAQFGGVEVDGKIKGFFPPPATITTGSGQPIQLTAGAGNVTVRNN
jgi:hypothetical protein